MKKRLKRIYCDTDKDILVDASVLSTEPNVQQEAFFHRNKQFCYLYKYIDKNGDKENERMIHKTKDEMNKHLDRVDSVSRIFTNKKEFDEYNAQSEELESIRDIN